MTSEELAKRDFRLSIMTLSVFNVLERLDTTDPTVVNQNKQARASEAMLRFMLKTSPPEKIEALIDDAKEFIDGELPVLLVEEAAKLLKVPTE